MKLFLIGAAIALFSFQAHARKDCEELKTEIDAKLKAKGVASFTLEIISADQVKDQRIAGSCDGGTKKITYKKN